MRSLLFVPADSERKLDKAREAGADALILDLEDSVAPARKSEARGLAVAFLAESDPASLVYVRINGLSTGLADDDLATVMAGRPTGIMLPKAEGGRDVALLAAKLRAHEAENGIQDGATRILPIVTETATAVFSAGSLAGSSERLSALTWGAEDLSAALGARTTRDETGRYTPVFAMARAVTLLAASAAQVPAIDTVFPAFRDAEGLARDCAEAERDGFTGKMAIHPAQVPVINAAFTPSQEAIDHARRVVAAFKDAGQTGVASLGGEMIDRPHLMRAERILERARLAGSA